MMDKLSKDKRPSFKTVVDAFHEGKVISSSITLKDLAAVSDKLSSVLGVDELASWTFITPGYIYTGSDNLIEQPEIVIRSPKA